MKALLNQHGKVIAATIVIVSLAVGLFGLIFGVYLSTDSSNTQAVSFVQQSNSANDANLKIKGNRSSKIYHLPGCPNYNDISERNTVWFKTKEEAEAAGYRMAKNC